MDQDAAEKKTSPGRARSTSRRTDVLAAAAGVFLEKGYAGTSMAALAQAAGVQKATLYHHFPNKEALFEACVAEGFDAGTEALKSIRDAVDLEPAAKLSAAIDELQRLIVFSEVGRMSPIIAEVATTLPAVGERFYTGFIQRQQDVLDAIIAEGVAAGDFARHGEHGLRYLVFGPLVTLSLSVQMLARSPERDALLDVERVCEESKDAILRLLLGGSATSAIKSGSEP